MKPSLTLFADASVHQRTKTRGWGFWIKGDGWASMNAGGPLKLWHENSSVAELEAIANGLSCADAAGYFQSSDRIIMLKTDNSEAIGCIRKFRPSVTESAHPDGMQVPVRRRKFKDRQKVAIEHIFQIIDKHNLVVIVRHVRGHCDGGGRNWVNRLCDDLAKRGRKSAERALREVVA